MINLKHVKPSILTLNDGHIISGYIVDRRVSEDEMPEYYHKYEMRSSDDGSKEYATLEKRVLVNFSSTFISKTEIDLNTNNGEYKEIKECDSGDIIS